VSSPFKLITRKQGEGPLELKRDEQKKTQGSGIVGECSVRREFPGHSGKSFQNNP